MTKIMSIRLLVCCSICAALLLLCSLPVTAQVPTGFPAFNKITTAPGGPEMIDPQTLNVHWTFPIFSKPGRGIPISYGLSYDSSVWYPVTNGGSSGWAQQPTWGWSLPTTQLTGLILQNLTSEDTCPSDYSTHIWSYSLSYQEPNGTVHPVGSYYYMYGYCQDWSNTPQEGTSDGPGFDDTGFQMTGFVPFSSGTILTPSGWTIVAPVSVNQAAPTAIASSVTDTNGNVVNISTSGVVTDTLGVPVFIASGSGTPASPYTFTYYAPSGTPETYTMRYASYNVRTNFGCPNLTEWHNTGINLVSEIDLPNGTKYTFTYEPTPGYSGWVTGRLALVGLPTGGSVSYSYGGYPNNGISCIDGSASGFVRTNFDGTANYSHTVTNYGNGPNTTTISVPYLGSSTHTYYGGGEAEQDFDTGGTVLRTVLTCRNDTPPTLGSSPGCVPGADGPAGQHVEYVYWPTGQMSRRDRFYQTFSIGGYPTPDANLPSEVDEYDYGSGAPGPLVRKTLTTYATTLGNIINKPATVTVQDGSGNIKAQTTFHYDEGSVAGSGAPQHVAVSTPRGNLTSVTELVQPGGPSITSGISTYFDTGEVNVARDFNNNPTTYQYSSTYGNAYPTTVTNALNQATNSTYDAYTGLVTAVTDPNGQMTSYAYDFMLRPTQVTYPDTGQTTTCYTDVGGSTCNATGAPFSIVTTRKMNTSQNMVTTAVLDNGGRDVQDQLNSDPEGTVYTDHYYSTLGNGVSNPYRSTSDSTYGVTQSVWDVLGRVVQTIEQDYSNVYVAYSGPCATVTDEAGKQRKSCSDALGRLTSVTEDPGSSPHLNYTTNYTYDLLDNLTSVTQNGARPRTFTYDALSRLTSATNPESGTTCYGTLSGSSCQQNGYDANGNLIYKTDARGVRTTFAYDALNRVVEKYYSDGTPYVYYGYEETSGWGYSLTNTVGRLSSIGTTHGIGTGWLTAAIFSYDGMGRQIFTQTITGNTMPIVTFSYDLLGNQTSLSYPSGRTVKTYYSTAARPTEVSYDNFNGTHITFDYLSSAHYAPNGAPTGLSLNGVSETYSYNSRLQPCSQQDSIGSFTWLNRNYSFYSSGSCSGMSGGNSGNLLSVADALQSNRTQSFSYDSLNRLASAQSAVNSGADCWGQTYGYDAWANLVSESVSKCSAPALSLSVDGNNHLTNSGFSYDAAGNMIHDASHGYTFDAENHLTKVDSGSTATYTYDADGSRVQKQVGSTNTNYIYSGGQVIAEYNPTTGDWSDYVYAGSRRLAKADSFTDLLHMSITTSGGGVTGDNFVAPTALTTRWVTAGDMLYLSEYQHDASGGFQIGFSDGTYASSSSGFVDQHGVGSNADTGQGWHSRSFSMSAYAGKSISGMDFIMSSGASGTWDLEIRNMVYVTADGTVIPIYTEQGSFNVTHWGYQPGVTSRSFTVDHVSGQAIVPGTTTAFYHEDHLGSSRAMSGTEGAPIWSATYLPFGQEWNPQATANHYKFTGYERDGSATTETGLDFASARFFSSPLARFMSPDWSDSPDAIPYVDLGDPQTLNLFSYVRNNPVTFSDPDGHCTPSPGVPMCQDEYPIGSEDFLEKMYDLQRTGQQILLDVGRQVVTDTVRIMHTPGGPACLANWTGGGMVAGGTGGALVGLSGVAAGGVGVVITEPSGIIIGGAGGAATGYVAGLAMCSQGSGGGGGGGNQRSSGSKARLTRPQQRQTANYLGMKEVKSMSSQDQLVFEKNGRFFSFSNTDHTAGEVFKELNRNGQRIATCDINLVRIGE